MTLVFKLDLETKIEVNRSNGSKVMACKHQNFMLFNVHDHDLDLMTLTLKLYLDMVETYLHDKNEANKSKVQKLWPGQNDTQTDGQTHRHV